MQELIETCKTQLEAVLNGSAFTTDSVEGWLCIILSLFLIYNITKKLGDFVGWCIGGIILIQVFYWLSFTGLNDLIPLSNIFKYDIFSNSCMILSQLLQSFFLVSSYILICSIS